MNKIEQIKNRNKKIVKDFLTKPTTLEQLGNKNGLTKESIRLILTSNLTHLEYKKRRAEIVSEARAKRLEKIGVHKVCAYCGKDFVRLHDYINQKYCSSECFYDFRRNRLSPEEKERVKKLRVKKYYAKYWQEKKTGKTI